MDSMQSAINNRLTPYFIPVKTTPALNFAAMLWEVSLTIGVMATKAAAIMKPLYRVINPCSVMIPKSVKPKPNSISRIIVRACPMLSARKIANPTVTTAME